MNRRGFISAVRWWHTLPSETSIDAVVKGVSLSSESVDLDHRLREGLGRLLRDVVADAREDTVRVGTGESIRVRRAIGELTVEVTRDG